MKSTRNFSLVLLAVLGFVLTGCVSPRYKAAPKDTRQPPALNLAFDPAPLEGVLLTLVTYNGPGSWKREAFWDEYVVTLHNPGAQPLIISNALLTDYAGTAHATGTNPWALERESKTLEQKYKDAGLAFVRYTTPAVVILGTGAVAVLGAGLYSTTAATLATATVVALPIYYIGVLTINHRNRLAMEKEFDRRRLALPMVLAAGETRTGSFFFPMVPGPQALSLPWSRESQGGEAVLKLGALRGLHLKTSDPAGRPAKP